MNARCDACNRPLPSAPTATDLVRCPHCGFENKAEPPQRNDFVVALLSGGAAVGCLIFALTSALAVLKVRSAPPPDVADLEARARGFTVQAIAWGATSLVVLVIAIVFYRRYKRGGGAAPSP
jgi:hypothetical protein